MARTLLLLMLVACNWDLDHDIDITIGIDDTCLSMIPSCYGPPDTYFCEDAEGNFAEGCRVGCLAGREIMCVEDGPRCVQDFAGEDETVPVFCLSRVMTE